MISLKKVKKMAKQITSNMKIPIDVDQITKKYLPVYETSINSKIISIFQPKNSYTEEPDVEAIYLNTTKNKMLLRFAEAHSLCHYLFQQCNGIHVDISFLSSYHSNVLYPKEIEANNFAIELLMPSKIVFKYVDELLKENTRDFRTITNIFCREFLVEEDAVEFRLRTLGIKG